MPYKEIDRQWVKTREEAEKLRKRLARTAAAKNLVVGVKPDDGGFLVTVERWEEPGDK